MKLKTLKPLGRGNCRLVFEHPQNSSLLIKVIRPDIIEKRFGKDSPPWRFKKNRRYGHYISFHREMQEFLVGRAESKQAVSFVQSIVGFIQTDLGLGMIVEAVRSSDGQLAPTLMELLENRRFDKRTEAALEYFFKKMIKSRMVFSDMNMNSLVYRDSTDEFVMIDGLGITNPIPLKAWSRRVNHRSKEKRFTKIRNRIALHDSSS